MHRFLTRMLLSACWLPGALCAQQATSVSASDEQFPTIQIDFTYRDPVAIGDDATVLYEGSPIDYSLTARPDSLLFSHKRILLLFENSYRPRFDAQRVAGISLLKQVFSEVIQDGDEVYVAQFDWTIDGAPDFVLLNDTATDDIAELHRLLDQIVSPRNDGRLVEETEIYPALMDGLEFLATRHPDKDDTAPLILLYSAEATNIHFSRFSQQDVILKSKELDIPIYTLQYPHYRDKYSFAEMSANTFGARTVLDQQEEALSSLVAQLSAATLRASGKRYSLQFESGKPAGKATHIITLQLSPVKSFDLTYHTQSPVTYWFRSLTNQLIALGLLLVIALGTGSWRRYTIRRKRQEKAQAEAAQAQQWQQVSAEAAEALQQQKAAFEKQIQAGERERLAKAKKQEEESRWQAIQHRFDALPRVPCLIAETGERFAIPGPKAVIGRVPQSDIVLADATISKQHAVVYFSTTREDGGGEPTDRFYLWDLNSTNGTYVNGHPVAKLSEQSPGKQPQPLKDQDLVQFGGQQYVFTT